MTTARWRRIEEIYQAAADLEFWQRAAFVESACDGDPELRHTVNGLLAADGNLDSAIETSIRAEADRLATEAGESMIGRRIGLYRVTGLIGAGGMGTVYRAVRDDDQFQKEVAVKVVRWGMDVDAVVRRFRRERQILARLEHPNIARLLDGGVMEDGRPYFVMEYVEGRPLVDYCADKPLKERLLLFRQVCAGVQHAHQSLVVHRDLKPANVLVTKNGAPKLLDFGLAKVLSADELAEQTCTFVRMLTPDYTSPEQVRGEADTTASDTYSLGAILYELVSGQHAHQFKNRTAAEMERIVCREDPPPLGGELGSIVQMAMQKEPQRRYTTVEQLSEDVRRYLEGLPVLARKENALYTARKFVRRNRLAVAALSVAVLTLLSGTLVATSQARRLEGQVRRVRSLANTMLFDVNDQIATIPGSLKARQTLVRTGLAYLDEVAAETGADPNLQRELAQGYLRIGILQGGPHPGEPNLGDAEGARKSYITALRLAEPLVRLNRNEVLPLLATIHLNLGKLTSTKEAIAHFRESIHIAESAPAQENWYLRPGSRNGSIRSQATLGLAEAYLRAGNPRAALEAARSPRVLAPSRSWTEAAALAAAGDLQSAAAMDRGNIAQAEGSLPNYPQGALGRRVLRIGASDAHCGLGNVLGNPFHLNLGDTAGALTEFRAALVHAEDNVSRDPADNAARVVVTGALAGLGACLQESKPIESVAAYSAAIRTLEEMLAMSPGNSDYRRYLALDLWQISYPLGKLGRREQALSAIRRSLALAPSAPAHNALGDLWLEAGERVKALEEYRRGLALAETEVAAKPFMMPLRRELADCYERLGSYNAGATNWRLARDWYVKSLAVWTTWAEFGVSSAYDQRRRREAAHAVARYGDTRDR